VHTAEEVDNVLAGKDDLGWLETPARDAHGRFDYGPNVIHAEGIADSGKWSDPTVPNFPPVSAADAATLCQGDLSAYPGVDSWSTEVAHEGDRIWFASSKPEDTSSIIGFGVPEGNLHDGQQEVALSAARYNEGAQVAPNSNLEYREYLDCYEFTQDTSIATGVATENSQYGNGGMPQMYVQDVKELLEQGRRLPPEERTGPALVYVGSVRLTDTSASWQVRGRGQ
jgi:hypothetical protein